MLSTCCRTLTALAIAASAVACTSHTPTTHPTAHLTPTVKPWTHAQAAAEYLRLVAPTNSAFDRELAAYKRHSLAGEQAALHDALANERLVIIGLKSPRWPSDTKPVIAVLLSDLDAQQLALHLAEIATTQAEYDAYITGAANSGFSKDGNALRKKLGLPAK